MIHSVFMDCAATYLYTPPSTQKKNVPEKKERKVEVVSATYCGKRFNSNASSKAQHSHIDILI